MSVSVVIPTFNRGSRIQRAVESVIENDGESVTEVIVVDDGSTDDSCSPLEALDPRVKVVSQANAGAAKARLVGIQESSCE